LGEHGLLAQIILFWIYDWFGWRGLVSKRSAPVQQNAFIAQPKIECMNGDKA